MLEEPFWLGLITVSIVLLVLGCVWCIKRKFADKLERFLAEEIERSKQSSQQRSRSSSIHKLNKLAISREQMNTVSSSPQPAARSLLSRLGRRKHSMLNLEAGIKPHYHENRSFSFDDLLRKGSPKKRNQASALTTTNVAPEEETKEILQSLVSPIPKLHRRMSLEEFIHFSEQKIKAAQKVEESAGFANEDYTGSETAETSFSSPPKPHKSLKKKVSFAKCVESAAEALAAQRLTTENEPYNLVTFKIGPLNRSDAEEMTSGDDVSIDVPIFSSSSSSPDSADESIGEQINRNSSSPVVVVHQPPILPQESPNHFASIITACNESSPLMVDSQGTEIERNKIRVNCSGSKALTVPNTEMALTKDINDSTAVFRCFETLTPENPLTKMILESPAMHPFTSTTEKITKRTPPLANRALFDEESKVHAIDDLAEALEKKKLEDLALPHPLQIPIFSMYETSQPYRKASLDAAMLRLTEGFPRRMSVDAATPFTSSSLGVPLAAATKAPLGVPMHHMMGSPTHQQRKSLQLIPGIHGDVDTLRLKAKPPPLQIPKIMQMESPRRQRMLDSEKPNSLDLQTPIITITSSMSSCDSDTDSPSKANVGIQYLSPFVMLCPTEDMSTSLSNLSSSGYSSMASPVPSRCGSNNPLCPSSENEQDPPTPRQVGFKPYTKAGFLCPHMSAMHQPRSPQLWGDRTPSTSSREVSPPSGKSSPRKRSGSETTDDQADAILTDDFNDDEGIGVENTDSHPKVKEQVTDQIEIPVKDPGPSLPNSLSVPAIIIQEGNDSDREVKWATSRRPSFEQTLSPVSSRSESPMSDTGINTSERFSPQTYNADRSIRVVFTDSDGIYDCPSSEVPLSGPVKPPSKRQGRRRDRPHPSKHKQSLITAARNKEDSQKEKNMLLVANKRSSPKRRTRAPPIMLDADSSSSDSSSSASVQDPLLPQTKQTIGPEGGSSVSLESNSPKCTGHCRRYPHSRGDALTPTTRNDSGREDFAPILIRDGKIGSERVQRTRADQKSQSFLAPQTDRHRYSDPISALKGSKPESRQANTVTSVLRHFAASNRHRNSMDSSAVESTDSEVDSHTTSIVPAIVHCWDEQDKPTVIPSGALHVGTNPQEPNEGPSSTRDNSEQGDLLASNKSQSSLHLATTSRFAFSVDDDENDNDDVVV